jgi:para-aminobenzoate synthetase/4-amino-4-deoxychorismate lyase
MANCVIREGGYSHWVRYREPARVIAAQTVEEVYPALQEVCRQAEQEGLTAVGFITYEAAPAFDRALVTLTAAGPLPFLWFALYDPREREHHFDLRSAIELDVTSGAGPPGAGAGGSVGTEDSEPAWVPSMDEEAYRSALTQVKEHIRRGDTYQVNFSYRLAASYEGSAAELFRRLVSAQPSEHAAFIETDRWAVCSVSPELFFSRREGLVELRPMKGTAARGRTLAEDRQAAAALQASEKDRAENLMIVDMIRNDVGRVAVPGSVEVPELFSLEKYPTLWQMTSRVRARGDVSTPELIRALFPCASITGAPKARTMEIISQLETSPRGVYTGAIGRIGPDGSARFSVAIRTATLDKREWQLSYGIGGGIVWDSEPALELSESRLKAAVLAPSRPPFELLETLYWSPRGGYWLFDEHMERLASSAEYFSLPMTVETVYDELSRAVAEADEPQRVRLLLSRAGSVRVERRPASGEPALRIAEAEAGERRRVALAAEPVDVTDPFLYHKTTHRTVYERAREQRPGYDDVLLWSADGWVTESTIANLVARVDGELVTPPVRCGLLDGTFRRRLLAEGCISERPIAVTDLSQADALYLVNALRGWTVADLDQ